MLKVLRNCWRLVLLLMREISGLVRTFVGKEQNMNKAIKELYGTIEESPIICKNIETKEDMQDCKSDMFKDKCHIKL